MHSIKLARLAVALALLATVGSARAADPVDGKAMLSLAESSGCLACHAMQRPKVGPSYAQIARRFQGQPGAVRTLQDAILNGHSGTWGIIPMPAYGGSQQVLTPDQARELARWVLAQATPAASASAPASAPGGKP